jgi:phospholipase/lecithinase/hemolysin
VNQTQTLHDLAGARSFLFLTVPPIQYTPTVLASGAENAAAEGRAVAQYNAALTERVAAFAKANVGVKVAVVDTTEPFMRAIDDPKAYGAADASCFDAGGTRCLWWNDVSFFLISFFVFLFVVEC